MRKSHIIFVALVLIIGSGTRMDLYGWKSSKKAIFAGGCFWCMESDFQNISGVKNVISGYIGGTGRNPTYQDYAKKGHIEAVQIIYDPSVITYEKLLELFWTLIDPTDADGQFCDRGYEYSTAIFYKTEDEKHWAEESKVRLERSAQLQKPVVTNIVKAGKFYYAENYHQNYAKRNPLKYKFYRYKCGRDSRLKELWGNKMEAGE